MHGFNLKILGSSSKGNSYILKADNETLLLECGVSFKQIQKGLDFNLLGIVGCLVSHEHQDHSKSIKELTRRGIKVYSAQETFTTLGIKSHNAVGIKPLQKFNIGNFEILPFDVEHDAVAPLGFLITHKSFGKLLFATDTYYIKYKFQDLNYLMIECNFSHKIIEKRIENNELHPHVAKRLFHSHMSLETVSKFLRDNDTSKLKEIYLMHLSEKNSDAEHFKKSIEKQTGIITTIC